MYCIYTNQYVPCSEGTWDHIFPLALGGKNQFTVWSHNKINSVIGSEVEARVASDLIIGLALNNTPIQGHRTKKHGLRWHKVMMNNKPVQVTFEKEKIRVWDLKSHRELSDKETSGKEFNASLSIYRNERTRFLAKLVLGGGYFIYRDSFIESVDCDPLRSLLFFDTSKIRQEKNSIMICDRFHPDCEYSSSAGVYRALCESIKRTILITYPHNDAISFHAGIAGEYLGSIIIPAKTDDLPIDADHDLGHVIVLGPGNLERYSFRDLCRNFAVSNGWSF